MKKIKLTSELFKEFTERVLNEHKNNKETYDYCIDVYSETQLFDLSNLKIETVPMTINEFNQVEIEDKQYNIPFSSVFIKINDSINVFLHNKSDFIITGMITLKDSNKEIRMPIVIENDLFLNQSKIRINDNRFKNLLTTLEDTFKNKEFIDIYVAFCGYVAFSLDVLNELQNKTVLYDEPTQIKTTYYRYKNKNKGVRKVNNKPIYIILNKEKHANKMKYDNINKQGKITYNISFAVIGHWRRLKDNYRLGKDRNGIYNIKGFTWVNSFIKGNKNMPLNNRERIVVTGD